MRSRRLSVCVYGPIGNVERLYRCRQRPCEERELSEASARTSCRRSRSSTSAIYFVTGLESSTIASLRACALLETCSRPCKAEAALADVAAARSDLLLASPRRPAPRNGSSLSSPLPCCMVSSRETGAGAARRRRGPRSRSRAGGRGRVRGRRSGGARGGRGADPSRDARSGRGRSGGEAVIGGAGRGRRARAARTLSREPVGEGRVDLGPYHVSSRWRTRRGRRHRGSCCRTRRRARTLLVLRRPASADDDGDARGDRRSDDERDDHDDDAPLGRLAPPSRARDAHARAAASRRALRRVDGDDLQGLLLLEPLLLVDRIVADAVQLDDLVRRLSRRRGRPSRG